MAWYYSIAAWNAHPTTRLPTLAWCGAQSVKISTYECQGQQHARCVPPVLVFFHVFVLFYSCVKTRSACAHLVSKTGTQLDANGKQCQPCPPHSVNPGGCVACTNCSMQHYTGSDTPRGTCVACPRGTIRQMSSGYAKCEPCPALFSVSSVTQQCELCTVPVGLQCTGLDTGHAYMDDCSEGERVAGEGCVCGCRPCELHRYSGIVKNFILLPGCRAGCEEGYKLRHFTDPNQKAGIRCVASHLVLQDPDFVLFNNGHYKLNNRDATDLTVQLCHTFFSLSLPQLESILHLTPSAPTHTPAEFIRVHDSILASYITDPRELWEIDKSCSFRCLPGYVAAPSLVTLIFECVPQALLSSGNTGEQCTAQTPSYQSSSCMAHGV